MSGNPFRASIIQNSPAAPPTSFPQSDSSARRTDVRPERDERDHDSVLDASSLPMRTKKSVRIESPTETIPPHPAFQYEEGGSAYEMGPGRHTGSPPPDFQGTTTDQLEDAELYSSERRQMDEHEMLRGLRIISGSSSTSQMSSGAPANPFARTLASIEPQEQGGEAAGQSKERFSTDKSTAGNPRQSLNIEGFKNLLMQGINSPRSSAPTSNAPSARPQNPPVFESSSTDTSSHSRQSIFEPSQEPTSASPQILDNMEASDDEHVGLVGGAKKEKGKRKPPPAPKPRHGKPVNRTPQTVPFSEFSATEATPPPPMHRRTNSDLNKPLPPTPPHASQPVHIISQDSTQPAVSIPDTRDEETESISDITPVQKRVPPPVPLARRQSQLRTSTAGNRSRSNSSLTIASQHSIEPPSSAHGQEPTSQPAHNKAAPPPPPSRRHRAALSVLNTGSANSSSTELSNSGLPQSSAVSSPELRRDTISSDPPSPVEQLARTSSMHSARNNYRSTSNDSTGMQPPPPPPPRRRQSGRSSLDLQRPNIATGSPSGSRHTSTEHKRTSFDGRRPGSIASVSSLKHEYAPTTADTEEALVSPREEAEEPVAQTSEMQRSGGSNASNNILDDMEKFQREIDELRERYRQAA